MLITAKLLHAFQAGQYNIYLIHCISFINLFGTGMYLIQAFSVVSYCSFCCLLAPIQSRFWALSLFNLASTPSPLFHNLGPSVGGKAWLKALCNLEIGGMYMYYTCDPIVANLPFDAFIFRIRNLHLTLDVLTRTFTAMSAT
jgi:hypothetical protein